MKKRLKVFCTGLSLILALQALPVNIPVLKDVVGANQVSAVTTIANGSFESGSSTTPSNWTADEWTSGSNFTWEQSAGINGSKCISITSNSYNDARWVQTVQLTPGKAYSLSAYVKGENIISDGASNTGANICLMGEWTSSGSTDSTGTFGWKKVYVDFVAPQSGSVQIGCRLGFYGSLMKGKAYFDNIEITELERRSGTNLYLDLESNQWSNFTGTNDTRWIGHLDNAYNKYYELVGTKPFNGANIGIMSSHIYLGYWAIAGNPINWNQPYVAEEIGRINLNDDWSFGILHEIGHDFDQESWNWDAEFWANTKMYYILEQLGGKVWQNNMYYVGSQLENYYRTDASGSYNNSIARGTYSGDGVTYCFIRIKNTIGWEPFKQTFRYFTSSGVNPSTKVAKFDLFLDKLSEYSGYNVRSTFLTGELDTIRNYLTSN
ncbi:M60 family metallopeptidase [Ruminiclostridium papyrosolvens]|uniref:Carbohydrate-binding protein CenC n=1 Tax=Ruminiclostridium papyrosolvens C7 TaxID=1330534 RepID=U4R2Z1_9FIRM|nr:M60 family metallopeptidase [Ruminiclostridium papyrosolvens]EPR12591.1 carbohydrate-binding protein CenC [Ruminiclostridium papyrosolvens C7]